MSVPFLRQAVKDGDSEKLIRFVRLHLGDGNDNLGSIAEQLHSFAIFLP